MMKETTVMRLMNTISKSTSPFHAAGEAEAQLQQAGYTKLGWRESWNLKRGGKYYVCPFGTTVIAFRVNPEGGSTQSVRISSAHIDSPGLRIKAGKDMESDYYLKINVEEYGGGIWNTWMDRPLSVAGRVILRGDNPFETNTRLIDFQEPIFVIPNLAIHLNRSVNEGIAVKPQTDLIPIAGCGEYQKGAFQKEMARRLKVREEDILSYEMCLYNQEQGTAAGLNGELLLAPRLDNLTSMQACLTGLAESSRAEGMDVIALFDHEEIGSRSRNGAASNLLESVLERAFYGLGYTRQAFLESMASGCYLSLDVAHADHPNHRDETDPTTGIRLNEGVAVKTTARQSYCTDGEMTGVLMQLAGIAGVPCRVNYPRSGSKGGSTVGPMVASGLLPNSADIGIPILAMHSAMETAGALDQCYLEELMKVYYGTEAV